MASNKKRPPNNVRTQHLKQALLDVPSGSGRNALLFASFGCPVVCVDRDTAALEALNRAQASYQGLISSINFDFEVDPWPFTEPIFGAALNVHHWSSHLLNLLIQSIVPDGLLVIETIQNRGENWRELPRTGEIKSTIDASYRIVHYHETKAGPQGIDAVTVRLIARKSSPVTCAKY